MLFYVLCMISGSIAQTVPSLNVNAYYGRWIQMYSNYFVKSTFEHNIVCDSAFYYPYHNKTVAVVNSGNVGDYNGTVSIVKGWAEQNNLNEPGKLTVHLQPTGGIPAAYWIYKLGPIVNGQYDYSIVSDNIKLSLFVLARNYTEFIYNYNNDVISWLFSNGFNNSYNRPIPTNQTNCKYPDVYYSY